jgi:hypothetical protein
MGNVKNFQEEGGLNHIPVVILELDTPMSCARKI